MQLDLLLGHVMWGHTKRVCPLLVQDVSVVLRLDIYGLRADATE